MKKLFFIKRDETKNFLLLAIIIISGLYGVFYVFSKNFCILGFCKLIDQGGLHYINTVMAGLFYTCLAVFLGLQGYKQAVKPKELRGLKQRLFNYKNLVNIQWARFRNNLKQGMNREKAFFEFKFSLLPSYNQILEHLGSSISLSEEFESKIRKIIFKTLDNNILTKDEELDKQLNEFIKEISQEMKKMKI